MIAQLASSLCASAIAVKCVCPEQPLPFQSKAHRRHVEESNPS